MSFYATLLGAILKINFIINQWKQPPDSLSTQSSPWTMTKHNTEVKGKEIRGGSRQGPEPVQVGGLVQGTETESDTAPWRPGQTQEFNLCLSHPGSTSSLYEIYVANGQKNGQKGSVLQKWKNSSLLCHSSGRFNDKTFPCPVMGGGSCSIFFFFKSFFKGFFFSLWI